MNLLFIVGIGSIELLVLLVIIGTPIFIVSTRFFKRRFNSEMTMKVIALSALVTILTIPMLAVAIWLFLIFIFDVRGH